MTIRIDRTLQEKYNQLSNETNHSRNELISMALQYAIRQYGNKKKNVKGPSVQRGPLLSLLERSVLSFCRFLSNSRSCRFSFALRFIIAPVGHSFAQSPQFLHFSGSIMAKLFSTLTASNLQAFSHFFAAYTSVGAGFSRLCARIGRMTLHYDLILGRSYSDNVVRTSVKRIYHIPRTYLCLLQLRRRIPG